MNKIIDLSDQIYDKDIMSLERFAKEIENRQTILALMVDMGMSKGDNYQKYFDELIEYQLAYDSAKDKFYREVLIPFTEGCKYSSWNLDFNSREVTFYD